MVSVLADLQVCTIDEKWKVKREDLDLIYPPWWSASNRPEGPEHPETMPLEYRSKHAWALLRATEERWTDQGLRIQTVELRRGADPDTGNPSWVVDVRSLPALLARDLNGRHHGACGLVLLRQLWRAIYTAMVPRRSGSSNGSKQ